jgi:group I intron endonuclease
MISEYVRRYPIMMGVYIIKNKINNKVYVGSTKNFNKREYTHKLMLLHGNHPNSYLQSAWNKYGTDNFEFQFIQECKEEFLTSIEQSYKTYYEHLSGVYNLAECNQNPMLGKHHSEYTKNLFKLC